MVLLVLDSDPSNKLPYNPNSFPDMIPLVERACDEFGIGGEKYHMYAVFRPTEGTFVTQIEQLSKSQSISGKMKDTESVVLRNVEEEAKDVVDKLERSLKAHESPKKTQEVVNLMKSAKTLVTKLKHNLNVDMFGEMFIEYDGIEKLVLLIMAADGNSQAYALAALINTLFYVSAIQYLKTQPSIIASIYQLIDKDAVNTQQQTLGLLYVLAEKMPDGYDYINAAAKSAAYTMGRSPYATLVERLGSTDITVKTRALTLINTMLKNAPSQRQLCKFMARLENLGIFDILVETADLTNQEFNIQRTNFQLSTGIILPTVGYESEVHRARIRELTDHVTGLEKNLERYVEQQNLYSLMSDDLMRFKKLEDMSLEKETMLSCFSPLNVYQEEQLNNLPVLKTGVINLKEAVKEKVYAIEKAQNQTMLVQKYNQNLKKQMQKLVGEMDARELEIKGKIQEKNQEVMKWEKLNQELKNQVEITLQEQSKIQNRLVETRTEFEKKIVELEAKNTAADEHKNKLEESEKFLKEKEQELKQSQNKIKMLEEEVQLKKKEVKTKEAQLVAAMKSPAPYQKQIQQVKEIKAKVDTSDMNVATELKGKDIEKLQIEMKKLQEEYKQAKATASQVKPATNIGSALPPIPPSGSAIPAIGGGSAIPAIGGSAIPSIGSAIPAIGGSAIPAMGGSAIPAMGGSAIPSMGGGSAIPAIGGSAIPAIGGGSAIPAIGGGSAIPAIGGGSAIPAIGGGSAIPAIGGGSAIPAIGGGSAIPAIGGGSAIPAIPPVGGGSAIPSIGGSAIPSIPPPGGSAIPAMGGSAIPSMGGSAIPSMGGSAIPMPPSGSAIPMPPGGSAIPMPPGGSAIPMPPPPGGSSIPMPPPPMGGGAIPPPLPGMGFPPPLPGMGGLPGLGGFGGIKKVQPTKPKVVPSKKLTALNWKRIIKDKEKKEDKPSIWSGMVEMDLKQQEVEELFAAKQKASAIAGPAAPVKPTKKKVFDGGESQKISITFKRMPAAKTLREAFLKMDETVISREIASSWSKAWPDNETLSQLIEEAQAEPNAQWDFAEEYMLGLADLKQVTPKLTQWKFKMGFQEEVDEFYEFFQKLTDGLNIIKNSKVIKTLLQASLSLGNILNGNTDKGQADGFSIDGVQRLGMIKDTNGKPAIQFVVKLMKEKLGSELETMRKDHKPANIRPNLDEQDDMIKVLIGAFNNCKKQTTKLISMIKDAKDKFPEVMTQFLEESVQKIDEVQEKRKKVGDLFQETLDFYEIPSKDAKAKSTQEFFKFFNEIIDMVEKNMPKDKPAGRTHKFGQKIGGGNMANLMAEMQSKMNK